MNLFKNLFKEKAPKLKLTLNSTEDFPENDPFYPRYAKLKALDGMNILKFPNFDQTFNFKPKDFEPICRIVVSERVTVEQYLYKPTKTLMAVKFVRVTFHRLETEFNEKVLKKWKQEMDLSRNLPDSKNLVKLYGFCLYGGNVLLCMEYMDMSIRELYKRYYMRGLLVTDTVIGAIGIAAVNAINDLKSKNIIHRDIKPQNILINKNGEIKVCDFGESRILEDSMASTVTGTIPYWPPERFVFDPDKPIKYTTQADVWSLGVTLAEIGCPNMPFIDLGEGDFGYAMVQKDIVNMTRETVHNRLQNNIKLPKTVVDFIMECLKPIEERPTAEKLLETEFYHTYNTIDCKIIKLILEEHKIWDNITELLTQNRQDLRVDKEFLESLIIKNQKEFLSKVDMEISKIMDCLEFFKEIIREYYETNQPKDEDLISEQCFMSIQLIRRIYDYGKQIYKFVKFDEELAILLCDLVVKAEFLNQLVKFALITIKVMLFSANKEQVSTTMKHEVAKKVLIFLAVEIAYNDNYVDQVDSAFTVCVNFISRITDADNEAVNLFIKNKGIELLFDIVKFQSMNNTVVNDLLLLVNNFMVTKPEKLLEIVENYIHILMSLLDVDNVAFMLMINFLKKCDVLKYHPKCDLNELNHILIEKLCSSKLTMYAHNEVANSKVQLENSLLFHLPAVQHFWLWVTANQLISSPKRDKYCALYQDLGIDEIMKALQNDPRSSKRVKDLTKIILLRMDSWKNHENIEKIMPRIEEINTCDVEDAYKYE